MSALNNIDNDTPKVLIWIVNAINILSLITSIIFGIFSIYFILHEHYYLAVFEAFFSILFLAIAIIIRKLKLGCFTMKKEVEVYYVVFKNIAEGIHNGDITYTSFTDKCQFDSWYTKTVAEWYEIVAEGVSLIRAKELCDHPIDDRADYLAHLKNVSDIFERL